MACLRTLLSQEVHRIAWTAPDMVPQEKVPGPRTGHVDKHYLAVLGQPVHRAVVGAGYTHIAGSFGHAGGILPAGTAVESMQLALHTLAVHTPDADKDLAGNLLARTVAVRAPPGSYMDLDTAAAAHGGWQHQQDSSVCFAPYLERPQD
mmetsp:Transcript_9365/g.32988  ORF Transcript_9365/g.32988 Transcript_9365/m.32988 type:complete len:149 (+) Transcript_9365:717-1163(+)